MDPVEEMSRESPREMQDEQDMSETSGNATRGRGEDGWRLEPERETKVFWNRASTWNLRKKVTMNESK